MHRSGLLITPLPMQCQRDWLQDGTQHSASLASCSRSLLAILEPNRPIVAFIQKQSSDDEETVASSKRRRSSASPSVEIVLVTKGCFQALSQAESRRKNSVHESGCRSSPSLSIADALNSGEETTPCRPSFRGKSPLWLPPARN